MKKVFSLVLAIAMVFGMSTMAFSAELTSAQTKTYKGTIIAGETTKVTVTVPTVFAATAVNDTFAPIAPANVADDFTPYLNGAPTATITALTVGGVATVEIEFEVTAGLSGTIGSTGHLLVFEDATAPTTLKLTLNLSGATIKAAATTTTNLIPSDAKVVGIASDWTDYLDWDKGNLSLNGTFNEDLNTKSQMVAGMFVWENFAPTQPNELWAPVRSTHLKDVGVRKTNPVNNSGTIRDVGFDGTKLRIRTVQYFLKCGKTDVAFDLDLTFKSKASGTVFPANFTIENEQTWMYDGQDYVEMTDPIYVQADVSLRNVEMFLGENLYITKSFGKDQKAYAHVSLELSAGDEKLFTQYSELSDVYTLYTVGVNSANVYSEFKDLGDTYFVYDENFKLLGTTADKKLPFSNKYYLTTKKVDLGASSNPTETPADEDSSTSVPTDTGAVGTGGGTVAAPSNYNPNTGC